MKTPYDWVTIAIFAGLIVLFMQRSTSQDDQPIHDPLWMYLLAGGGCALANYLGNEEMHLPAIAMIGVTIAFIIHYLKPFSIGRPR